MIAETLGAVAGGYLLLMGGMAMFQRDMIYHPGMLAVEPADAGLPEMVPVHVRAEDGVMVTSWYAPPKDPRAPTILFFHGNAGTIAHRAHKARALIDAGFGVFLAEYRGYGGNPGRPSETGLYADARAALHWLLGRGLPASRVVLYGESLGTGVAVQMATEVEGLLAVMLEAPYTRLPELAPAIVPPGLAGVLMVDVYDSRGKLDRLTAPLFIMHGEQDGVVPVAMGRLLLEEAAVEKEGVFLPQAGHNDIWDLGGGEAAVAWLKARLG